MATAESVKAKLQGLIATANATTGNSDTNLTTAMATLIAGFGQGGGGGGGGGGALIASGKYSDSVSGTRTALTITHDLGVVPDIVVVSSVSGRGSGYVGFTAGFSSKLLSVLNNFGHPRWAGNNAGNGWYSNAIDVATSGPAVYNANENTFSFGNNSYKIPAYPSYYWIAIGGLA